MERGGGHGHARRQGKASVMSGGVLRRLIVLKLPPPPSPSPHTPLTPREALDSSGGCVIKECMTWSDNV